MVTFRQIAAGGFSKVAEWQLVHDKAMIKPLANGGMPRCPGVYLICCDAAVNYIGKADESLHDRMGSYVRGVNRAIEKRGSWRPVHNGTAMALDRDVSVLIYIFIIKAKSERFDSSWRGFPLDRMIGLESV